MHLAWQLYTIHIDSVYTAVTESQQNCVEMSVGMKWSFRIDAIVYLIVFLFYMKLFLLFATTFN